MKDSIDEPQLIPFTPVALRARHDGWTAGRQIAFIEALAESACVEEACRRVGMSDSAAYRLRRSHRGQPFREAWDAALDYALHRLEQAALSRALHGVPRPVFYKGEQVGEWRDYDERLTMFLLSFRRQLRSAAATEQIAATPRRLLGDPGEEAADRLASAIETIGGYAELFDEDGGRSARALEE